MCRGKADISNDASSRIKAYLGSSEYGTQLENLQYRLQHVQLPHHPAALAALCSGRQRSEQEVWRRT